jgi:hypothetical protein
MITGVSCETHGEADPSRELLDIIAELGRIMRLLARVGVTFTLVESYQTVLDECSNFLVQSGRKRHPR